LQNSFSGSFGPANANYLAQAQIYNRLQAQANLLAYVDVYFILCALSLLMIPLTLLLRRNDPKESAKNKVAVH
jgi:DHA2 family multidrug resistance protein